MDKFYAGIGSRETHPDYLDLMKKLAQRLGQEGYVLRSGGANGADTAFEEGARQFPQHIYLPRRGFNGRRKGIVACELPNWEQAQAIASKFHPGWMNLDGWSKAFMARNAYQMLGHDLNTPSRFVICWARRPQFNDKGEVINVDGGTGQAVRMAAHYGVPVYHLGVLEHRQRMCAYLGIDLLPEPPELPKPPKRHRQPKC